MKSALLSCPFPRQLDKEKTVNIGLSPEPVQREPKNFTVRAERGRM